MASRALDDPLTCEHCGRVVTPGWTIVCDHCRLPLSPVADGTTWEPPPTSDRVRRGRLIPGLLAIAGLGWAAIAVLFFVTYLQVQALVIFGVPAGLFLAAASGWWDGRGWAPGAAALAAIVTIALACVIFVGRFGLADVPGAG
jgi:hypothetical protein